MSWRGIDNQTYYMVDTSQYHQLLNYSGCGNTVSGNHPVTRRLIIDSLKRCCPCPTLSVCTYLCSYIYCSVPVYSSIAFLSCTYI